MKTSTESIGRLRRRLRAFSLAELMVTLGMIGILGGLVVASLSSIQKRSMAREQLEVARGSLYEWRDKSRNAHMIGCIATTDDEAGTYEIEFKMLQAGNCTSHVAGDVVPGSQASFKISGVQSISTQHVDVRGNVLEQATDMWIGSFTVDGTPGGFSGLIQGVQPKSVYLTESLQQLASTCGNINLRAGMRIEQDSSGGIHVFHSQG
jgi:type II secretory pathway pseudopilin PulG